MALNIFDTLLLISTTSLLVNALFLRIKIPVVVGYIIVGILLGPNSFKIISNSHDIHAVAEFGIVFLMFYIGLEFSLARLNTMRRAVFYFGGMQVFFSIIITLIVGLYIGLNPTQALIVGCITAMSSTAIVIKQLADQFEVNMLHSQNAIGILLFQDLAVIPILMMVPTLATENMGGLTEDLAMALVKGVVVIIAIFFIGRRLLRPLYYAISHTRSLELFTLTSLLITLVSAWLTFKLGLSLTLGAFLAGMMLGETEFKHQIETDIRPVKDILLGFFFITVGMQVNLGIIYDAWQWVALLIFALVFFKTFLIFALGYFFLPSPANALRTGLVLAQGGEFGIAILGPAITFSLIPNDYAQVILGALLISMCAAPLIIKYNRNIALLFFAPPKNDLADEAYIPQENIKLRNHVIICGYGRVGQNIARFLDKAKIPFIAFDLDPERVKTARLAGDKVSYADATSLENLYRAGLVDAKALAIGFNDVNTTIKVIRQVRNTRLRIPIIVRSHDEVEANIYYQNGATEVIPDFLEASLTMASHVLLVMKISPKVVNEWVNESRNNRYDLLRMIFPTTKSTKQHDELEFEKKSLHLLTLPAGAFAIDKSIKNLALDKIGIKITTIRRGKVRIQDPISSFVFQANDNVVIYSNQTNFELVEKALLQGL